jgi:mRNA degradation ribonuclease J1/J2
MAALSRLAAGTHRKITLKRGDTVIMSSNPIPGNEEAVNRVVNALYERDIAVFYPPTYKVHTSGHASQEELKLVFDLARPRFFIPWHGEPRHQVNHLRLAASMPRPPKKAIIPRNGDVVTITKDDIKVTGQVEAGIIYIDSVGKSADEIDEPIIRDRQMLSEEGIVVIMAVASRTPERRGAHARRRAGQQRAHQGARAHRARGRHPRRQGEAPPAGHPRRHLLPGAAASAQGDGRNPSSCPPSSKDSRTASARKPLMLPRMLEG